MTHTVCIIMRLNMHLHLLFLQIYQSGWMNFKLNSDHFLGFVILFIARIKIKPANMEGESEKKCFGTEYLNYIII